MIRQPTNKAFISAISALALTAGLNGCQEWTAEPVRVEENYGQSVRTAYLDQIYDPARARNPDAYAPDGRIDGIKSIKVLQRGYQADIGQPQRIREIQGFSLQQGGGGGGGGAGGSGGQ
ncbi:MAG: hypothetical protein RLZZ09_1955 [Pseudomonadota bacterium]|jgi:hypothetical protein